jgi:cytosine/adenosine deaminase-related metal-dependent hydrolase
LLAAHGVSVVHNPGSNLRLGNGIAPLAMMLQHGVNVALGLDSQALNDDGDLLQELRLAALLARSAGADGVAPNARQMLALATRNGARALGVDSTVGSLADGMQADLITIDPARLQLFDNAVPLDVRDLLLQRGKMGDVDSVIVAGQLLYHAGRHLTIDKAALQREIAAQLRHAGAHGELSELIVQLLPYLRRHIAEL